MHAPRPMFRRVGGGAVATALTASLLVTTAGPSSAADPERMLTSTTTHPQGRDVTTTFLAARIEAAADGFQGAASDLPASPDQPGEATAVAGPLRLDGDLLDSRSTSETPYQRFDLPWRGAGQSVLWSGQVDTARTVVLSAWDGQRWEELTRARGLGDETLTLRTEVGAQHRDGSVVPILVHAEDPFADDIDHEVKPGFDDPWDYDFAIAHHTDTQHMVRGSITKKTPAERLLWQRGFSDATKWIADNAEVRKIAFAAHTGDLIEDWVNDNDKANKTLAVQQYASASAAQRTLDQAGVVNATLPGNHDNLHGRDNGPGSLYNTVFGPERYQALAQTDAWREAGATYEPWAEGDASNSVTTFSAAGLDFVVVSLGFGVTDAEAAWADRVLKSYPDRNAIVMTHAYATASPSPDGRGSGFAEDGQRIHDRVIAKNPNVALVLAGHKEGVSIGVRKDAGERGNHVLELMANYQYYSFSAGELGIDKLGGYDPSSQHRLGASFLRLLQFDVDRSEVSIDTYSPYRNLFGATSQDRRNRYDGREDDMRLPVQLTSRRTSFRTDALLSIAPGSEMIGEVTTGSGEAAEVAWSGLTAGRTYGWHAVATDATSGAPLAGDSPAAWFVARAGSDSTPPRLRVPGTSSVRHGQAFDPMSGVSARDDDGTSLTSKVLVTGRIDTTRPGSQALSYVVSDKAGNTAVATRSVVVARPPAPVLTAAPRLSGKNAVGEVLEATRGTWSNLGDADVRIQWLRNGSAIKGATGIQYLLTPADVGKVIRARVTVRATGRQAVEADSSHVVVPKLKAKLHTSLTKKVSRKKKPLLKVRLSNEWTRVGGYVEVRVSGKRVATLKLSSSSRAQVRLPKMKPATRTVKITYLGSGTFSSTSTKLKIKVTKK